MAQDRASIETSLKQLLQDSLGLPAGLVSGFTPDTPLFGALPELDSLALANLLTEIEDWFEILIDDDDVDADLFASFGQLTDFVVRKLAQ